MSKRRKRVGTKKKRDINLLPPWAILRVPEICDCVGCGRSTLYQYIKDGKFPPLMKISERSSGQTVEKTKQACQEMGA